MLDKEQVVEVSFVSFLRWHSNEREFSPYACAQGRGELGGASGDASNDYDDDDCASASKMDANRLLTFGC